MIAWLWPSVLVCGSSVSGSLAAIVRTFFFWARAAGGVGEGAQAHGHEHRQDGDGAEREP